MCVKRRQPVELVDVPDPDGRNRRAGVLASLLTVRPGLAAVINALVTPGPPRRMIPEAARRTLDVPVGLPVPGTAGPPGGLPA